MLGNGKCNFTDLITNNIIKTPSMASSVQGKYICMYAYAYICIYTYIHDTCAWTPNGVLMFCLWCYLCYAIFALLYLHCNFCSGPFKNHFVTGACFTCTRYRINNPVFHYFSLLLMLLMLPDNQPYSFAKV